MAMEKVSLLGSSCKEGTQENVDARLLEEVTRKISEVKCLARIRDRLR